jgi:tetratricopeptide (TPR) repeat protein
MGDHSPRAVTRRLTRFQVLVAVAAAAGAAGWGLYGYAVRSDKSALPVRSGVPQPVVALPDLSRLEPFLQDQVRRQHAAFVAAVERGAGRAEQAEAAGALGRLLFATEHLGEAEALFERAQELAPNDRRWPYYLAHIHRVRQQAERAIAAFERALALAPDDVPTLVWLGELHLGRGDPAAAEPYLRGAAALAPTSAAVLWRLGRAALMRRDYAAAVDHLERALSRAPDAPAVHYLLAMAYRGTGDLAKAEAHVKQSGRGGDVPPDDPLMDQLGALLQNAAAHEARGMQALEARQWTRAVEHLQAAAELSPGNAVIRLNLGTALSLAGDRDAARRELLEAVRLLPGLARAHFALGLLAQDEGQWDEAIERLSTAIGHEPDFVDARFALAEALRRTGRPAESLPHYAKVLALDAAASQARFGYAMALVRLGRYAEAAGWLADAMRLHPSQPGFPHALARILAAAPDDRVRDGRRALELMQPLAHDPSPAVQETMAMAMAEIGRFDEAIAWQERAIATATRREESALAAHLRGNLARYRQGQPCRTPWRADDPVHTTAGASVGIR